VLSLPLPLTAGEPHSRILVGAVLLPHGRPWLDPIAWISLVLGGFL
jgi:hypothetical protein